MLSDEGVKFGVGNAKNVKSENSIAEGFEELMGDFVSYPPAYASSELCRRQPSVEKEGSAHEDDPLDQTHALSQ